MTAARQAADKAVMEKASKLYKGIVAAHVDNETGTTRETLENLKVGPHRILTPLSQQGFSKGRDWGGGGFPVFP